ncbi:hypothetical protein JTB14_002919 [Gonioctena quinquepunctata]|nr:hypothetical protein JTB14_002919 [Gonioctena quinquepunctata]
MAMGKMTDGKEYEQKIRMKMKEMDDGTSERRSGKKPERQQRRNNTENKTEGPRKKKEITKWKHGQNIGTKRTRDEQ